MRRHRRLFVLLAAVGGGAAVACQEDVASPGLCPDFCPADSVATRDTVLFAVMGDSATRPYVVAYDAPFLQVIARAGLESRAFLVTNVVPDSLEVDTSVVGAEVVQYTDFARVSVTIARRDTASHNLTLVFYRLPVATDSTATYASLDTYFGSGLDIRRINIDTLLAKNGVVDSTRTDSICGDTVGTRATAAGGRLDTVRVDRAFVSTDSAVITVLVVLDSTTFPFTSADSGQAGIGVRVEADTLQQVVLGGLEGGFGSILTWYQCFDSTTKVVRRQRPAVVIRDGYVFSPDTTPVGSDLVIGGMPSARSWLRFDLSDAFLDSNTVVRATLQLLPTVAPDGAPSDSFQIDALGVQSDHGAKSVLLQGVGAVDNATVRMGSTDTLDIELGFLLRFWAARKALPRMVMLKETVEGYSFGEARFGASTGTAALRPRLHLTYVPRFPFRNP